MILRKIILHFTFVFIVFQVSCNSDDDKSSKISDIDEISNLMNRQLQIAEGSFIIDPSEVEIDDTIEILSNNDIEVIGITPGESVSNSISFNAPNANVTSVGMRFGTSGPITFVPVNNTNRNTFGRGTFDFILPNNICDDLSSICHDIKCYEFASTTAGNISRANITQVAMLCGNCNEPSCSGLVDESDCEDNLSNLGNNDCNNFLESELEDFLLKNDAFLQNPTTSNCRSVKNAALDLLEKARGCDPSSAQSINEAASLWRDINCSDF